MDVLRCSFRRTGTVDESMRQTTRKPPTRDSDVFSKKSMRQMWMEIAQLASTINFSAEEDTMIWQFTSNGMYSSQSLYRSINFRGIIPVYRLDLWPLRSLL